MATLGLALLHDYPNYYHYFSTDRFYYGGAVHANHNRLLGSYSGLDGIKTGYTSASGFNLVASAFRDGRRFIGVVLGARSPVDRGMIMVGLLDQAFDGGEIIEAQEEDPATPAQIQFAGASAQGTEMAEVVATRSAPPRMMVGAAARPESLDARSGPGGAGPEAALKADRPEAGQLVEHPNAISPIGYFGLAEGMSSRPRCHSPGLTSSIRPVVHVRR